MNGENNGKPYEQMDDLGKRHEFSEMTSLSHFRTMNLKV